ncbi:MAG: ORF6N domain-containing protein [Lachnospiraceae bacterium]|nr:ORF6N domain-containing protein [Lachnospiraceae bacterium]
MVQKESAAIEKINSDVNIETITVQSLIHVIRDKQVMLDSDLAMLYQVETGALNRAVKRNEKRFPEDFRYQLTEVEYSSLKCQTGISSSTKTGYGGRRSLPYVFTEQGISMLASVLHSDVAINMSISIMRAFAEMRHFIANNQMLFERISSFELNQLEYQRKTDERIDLIFNYIFDHEESNQKIFFDGQIYDAFSVLIDLVGGATKSIVLVDNYVDVRTLNILSKKKTDVPVIIYTARKTRLSEKDVETFNQQYPKLEVQYTGVFHDRFLIIDDEKAYHIGASLKDAGKKCFAISLLNDSGVIYNILQRLGVETQEHDSKEYIQIGRRGRE